MKKEQCLTDPVFQADLAYYLAFQIQMQHWWGSWDCSSEASVSININRLIVMVWARNGNAVQAIQQEAEQWRELGGGDQVPEFPNSSRWRVLKGEKIKDLQGNHSFFQVSKIQCN